MIDPQTAAILRELVDIVQDIELRDRPVPPGSCDADKRLQRLRDQLTDLARMPLHVHWVNVTSSRDGRIREECPCGFVRYAFGEWHKEP